MQDQDVMALCKVKDWFALKRVIDAQRKSVQVLIIVTAVFEAYYDEIDIENKDNQGTKIKENYGLHYWDDKLRSVVDAPLLLKTACLFDFFAAYGRAKSSFIEKEVEKGEVRLAGLEDALVAEKIKEYVQIEQNKFVLAQLLEENEYSHYKEIIEKCLGDLTITDEMRARETERARENHKKKYEQNDLERKLAEKAATQLGMLFEIDPTSFNLFKQEVYKKYVITFKAELINQINQYCTILDKTNIEFKFVNRENMKFIKIQSTIQEVVAELDKLNLVKGIEKLTC